MDPVRIGEKGEHSGRPVIRAEDVEQEVSRLFATGTDGLVITVHGGGTVSAREDAFRELLASLALYDDRFADRAAEITVEPPSREALTSALGVLGKPYLQRKLFQRILWTFGRQMVDPLGAILDAAPGGALIERLTSMRSELLRVASQLSLTRETQSILSNDLTKLLDSEYLTMLAEHEERVQRPRLERLAREMLHLIGATFQRSFRQWPAHAAQISESVHHRLGPRVSLRENPRVLRQKIVEGIDDFLWVETSTELTGALEGLYRTHRADTLLAGPPQLERAVYREFAEACWELIAEHA